MKYVDEFRDRELAERLAATIAREARSPRGTYHIMEFCGGHTHAIFRYGVQDLMPENVRFVHGPGCPVCVLPVGPHRQRDRAGRAARRDPLQLWRHDARAGLGARSLIKAKADGADIRMVYSIDDALKIARENPDREVVFFAIGFETTTPPTAVAHPRGARPRASKNFSVFCNHVLTPAAIQHILREPRRARARHACPSTAFSGPRMSRSVIGSAALRIFRRGVPAAGGDRRLRAARRHAGDADGDPPAQRGPPRGRERVCPRRHARGQSQGAERWSPRCSSCGASFEWRGLGEVPYSALRIKEAYADFDAERASTSRPKPSRDAKSCECPAILRGVKKPTDCKLFGTVCTPDNPIGSCMVSSEGACAAYWTYGRFRQGAAVAAPQTEAAA